MDIEEVKADIEHQRVLQTKYRKRLRATEQNAAEFSKGLTPAHLKTDIDELKELIKGCDTEIAQLKAQVIDPHKRELEAFNAMRQVLLNESATNWILSSVIKYIGGNLEKFDAYAIRELGETVSSICYVHVLRLQEAITEVEKL